MGHRESDHINGNMILRPDIHVRYPNTFQFTDKVGWDFYNQQFFMRVGIDTNLIFQNYRRATITRNEIPFIVKNDVIPALFHGVPDQINGKPVRVGKDARQFIRDMLVEGIDINA